MSSSDSEDSLTSGSTNNGKEDLQAAFVAIIKDYPVVFQKSQTPTIRKLRSAKLEEIRQTYEKNFGKETTLSQLLKKLNNMRGRLKKKVDRNRSGNKKIKLKVWETELLKMMEGDTNPVINKIPGMEWHMFSFILSLGTQY